MATRDITAEFFKFKSNIESTGRKGKGRTRNRSRSRSRSNDKDDSFYTNSSSTHTTTPNSTSTSGSLAYNFASIKHQLPPLWVDLVENVEDKLSAIQENQRILSELHRERLMDVIGTSEENNEKEIENITTKITDLFRQAESALVKIDRSDLDMPSSASLESGEENGSGSGSSKMMTGDSDIKLRKNIQRALAGKLHSESSIFRQNQREYLCKLKAQKNGTTEEQEFAFLNENEQKNKEGLNTSGDLTLDQIDFVDITTDIVEGRDQEITAIAQSIEELATIMKELAALVIDQGTILDRIDYNMDVTVERVKDGMSELEKAEKYQKSATPVKCIIVLLLIIFFLAIVLLFKHVKPGGS